MNKKANEQNEEKKNKRGRVPYESLQKELKQARQRIEELERDRNKRALYNMENEIPQKIAEERKNQ